MPRPDINPRRPVRAPRYDYRANRPFLHERRGDFGPMIFDAVSGALVSERYAVDGPYGRVDSRNGAVVDVDQNQHEVAINMLGPQPDILSGNMGRIGPGYFHEEEE